MADRSPDREPISVRAPSFFMLVMSGLIALSWAALLLWQTSPYGRYLDHGRWTEVGLVATICGGLQPMLVYAGGWLLMLTAMMLPTTLPLLQRFQIMVSARTDQGSLVGLLIAGYLLAWTVFGIAAHGLDLSVHLVARHAAWLTSHAWLVGATVLLIAGAF